MDNKEINYYVSLGYSQKQAEKIANLNFERKFDIDGFSVKTVMKNFGMPLGGRSVNTKMPEPMVLADAGAPADGFAVSEPAASLSNIAESQIISSFGTEICEALRSDEYKDFEDSRFKSVVTSPTSTFRTTYNTAAATIILSNYNNMLSTSHDMVRTEEILNYIDYKLDLPTENKFSVTPEFVDNGDGTARLFIGIQGQKILPRKQNIVLLIDTSGSMCSKTLQIRATIATVFARMNKGDIFSIVTYSDVDHTFINGMKKNDINDVDNVIKKLDKMYISGCTYGSKGIETAYDIVKENFVEDGINRVIMVTDGDLNFGITDGAGLKELIEKKKKSGAFFSAIGTGILNLKDDKLETLAKNGNGNYFVINDVDHIKKCLGDRYESLVYPIAVDVKAQVEFNPQFVSEYRLIGFENRMLSHEDFTNDNVIAETFGSGSSCIALYELKLAGSSLNDNIKPLKYQKAVLTGSDELCTVSVRYKDIGEEKSSDLTFPVYKSSCPSDNSVVAWKAAELCDKLKSSEDNGDKRNAIRKLKEICFNENTEE